MSTTRATFTLEAELARAARELGVNVSAAARDGVASAVAHERARRDRAAYERTPERIDPFWNHAEAWSEA